MAKTDYETVYRRRAQGKAFPKVGLPDGIRPGDFLTFFIDNAYHSRWVASVHKGYAVTEPLVWKEFVLAPSRKVFWEDMDSATRLKVAVAGKIPSVTDPVPLPLVVTPVQTPKPRSESSVVVQASEVQDLWALLDDK